MDSVRGHQEQEGREPVTHCPHCKTGHIVIAQFHDHGVWFREHRCVNCGRYYPVEVRSVVVPPELRKPENVKPWRRISGEIMAQAKKLLDAGHCVAHAARETGMSPWGLRNIVIREGWTVVSARPNRRRG